MLRTYSEGVGGGRPATGALRGRGRPAPDLGVRVHFYSNSFIIPLFYSSSFLQYSLILHPVFPCPLIMPLFYSNSLVLQ